MKKTPDHLPRIGVFGHYGNRNLGDEAIIAAVINSINRLRPGAKISGFSMNPDDTTNRHKIEAFPIRNIKRIVSDTATKYKHSLNEANQDFSDPKIKRMLKTMPPLFYLLKFLYKLPHAVLGFFKELALLRRSAKILKQHDMLLISGSGQLFDDWGGPFAYPYTLLKWTALARWTGTRVAFLSLGASPIKSGVSRLFIRKALNLANYRSFRDLSSQKLICGIGFKRKHYVFPDLAWSLPFHKSGHRLEEINKTIGINPIPYCDPRYWPEHDPARYDAYVKKLAAFAESRLSDGYTIKFFCTKQDTDGLVVQDIKKTLGEENIVYSEINLIDREIHTLDELLDSIADCGIVIASRFHGVLLSCLMHKPVIGLAYEPKTVDILNNLGIVKFAINIDEFDADILNRFVAEIMLQKDRITDNLTRHVTDIRNKLDDQYKMIFDLP
jgi:polysaccharide pyruvyl transferase WcaK-like protein